MNINSRISDNSTINKIHKLKNPCFPDSVKLKRKRFQMIKAKALSGANIRQGTLDDDKRNIQEDILCLMYLKGFKKGDESAESVIKG